MTQRQEHFDTALAHLRKQGRKALAHHGGCAYRGKAGAKCAIGALIPDDRYEPEMEGRSARHSMILTALDVDRNIKNSNFYGTLQNMLHDGVKEHFFLDMLEENAAKFARRFNLKYKAPTNDPTD